MNDPFTQLSSWSHSATEVIFDDEIKQKLGEYGALGQENSQHIRAFTFRYSCNNALVSGFLVVPRKTSPKPLPVVIFNRGGNKDYGFVKRGTLFTRLAWLARAGYVVVGSQYPGNTASEGKDEWGGTDLESVLALYSLITHLSIANEERIGMLGTSRGGMMACRALTQVNWIQAAVTIAGVTNLIRLAELRPEMQSIFEQAFGGSLKNKQARSAILWADKLPDVPLPIMHGTADTKVSPLDSLDLATELYKKNKPFSLILFKGAKHGLPEVREEWHKQTIRWFDQYLQ